jgi:hypothetical protein
MSSSVGYCSFTINGLPANGQTLKIGDDHDCLLVIYGDNTGARIDFVVKASIDDDDSAAIMNKYGVDGGSGQAITVDVTGNVLTASWTITSLETRNLPNDSMLVYGVQMLKTTKTKTVEEGSFKLSLDVVRKDD